MLKNELRISNYVATKVFERYTDAPQNTGDIGWRGGVLVRGDDGPCMLWLPFMGDAMICKTAAEAMFLVYDFLLENGADFEVAAFELTFHFERNIRTIKYSLVKDPPTTPASIETTPDIL